MCVWLPTGLCIQQWSLPFCGWVVSHCMHAPPCFIRSPLWAVSPLGRVRQNAALNIHIQVFLERTLLLLLGKYLAVGLLDPPGSIHFTQRHRQTGFQRHAAICIPTSNECVSLPAAARPHQHWVWWVLLVQLFHPLCRGASWYCSCAPFRVI